MIFCRFLGYQFTKYGHYVFSISEGDLNQRNDQLNKAELNIYTDIKKNIQIIKNS